MITIEVTTSNSQAGITLPKEALKHLGVKEGDRLSLYKTEGGYNILQEGDNMINLQLSVAEQGMKDYAKTLKKLAE